MITTDNLFNPFPGLRSFEEGEDHLFFGREKQIDELLYKLSSAHFLAVVGSSGSGKSSLIKSGLLPGLYSGQVAALGTSWNLALFRPGRDPIGNMSRALTKVINLDPEDQTDNQSVIEKTLRRDSEGLVKMKQASDLGAQENLLLVVDQFEELFRYHEHHEAAIGERHDDVMFINLLLHAYQQKEANIFIVLTMRSDFLGACTEFHGLPEAVNKSQYLIPRMTREEREVAITGPIAVGGGTITPRLVTRLLDDVGDNPDQLPILQHALMRTWDYWENTDQAQGALDISHYEAIGTMKEALSLHAEEAFAEIEGDQLKAAAAAIFKALTDRGEVGQGVRRPIRLREICELTGSSKEVVTGIIDVFRTKGRSFLMPLEQVTIGEETVIDISHESLMRIWTRLIQWVKEESQSAEIYMRLAAAAALYQEGEAGLWRGPELELALRWQEEARPNVLWAQRYDVSYERAMSFLTHSRKQRDLEIETRERQQQQRLRRARIIAMVIGVAGFFSLMLSFVAYDQKLQADEQRSIAVQQTEVAERNAEEANFQREVAEEQKQIAESNEEKARKNEAEAVRQQQIAIRNETEAKRQEKRAQENAAEARKQRNVAEIQRAQAEAAKEVAEERRKQAQEARERAEEERKKALRLKNLAQSRNQSLAAIRLLNSDDQTQGIREAVAAHELNRANGGPRQNKDNYLALLTAYRLGEDYAILEEEHSAGVRAMTINPMNGDVATGDDLGHIYISSVKATEKVPHKVLKVGSPVRSLHYSPDGDYLVAGTQDGRVLYWPENLDEPIEVVSAGKSVSFVALVYQGEQKQLIFQAGQQLFHVEIDGNEEGAILPLIDCTLAILSKDGTHLLAAEGSVVSLYQIQKASSTPILLELVHTVALESSEWVTSLALSDNLKYLAIGTEEGKLYLNDTSGQELDYLPGHSATVSALAFKQFEETLQLVSAGYDQHATLIDIDDWSSARQKEDLISIPLDLKWLYCATYSLHGDFLLIAGANKGVHVWPVKADQIRDHLMDTDQSTSD